MRRNDKADTWKSKALARRKYNERQIEVNFITEKNIFGYSKYG